MESPLEKQGLNDNSSLKEVSKWLSFEYLKEHLQQWSTKAGWYLQESTHVHLILIYTTSNMTAMPPWIEVNPQSRPLRQDFALLANHCSLSMCFRNICKYSSKHPAQVTSGSRNQHVYRKWKSWDNLADQLPRSFLEDMNECTWFQGRNGNATLTFLPFSRFILSSLETQ